jgi:hypothetical protein
MKDLTKGKMPTWAIVVYYIIMVPMGLLLYPAVKIYTWIAIKRYMRRFDKEFGAY